MDGASGRREAEKSHRRTAPPSKHDRRPMALTFAPVTADRHSHRDRGPRGHVTHAGVVRASGKASRKVLPTARDALVSSSGLVREIFRINIVDSAGAELAGTARRTAAAARLDAGRPIQLDRRCAPARVSFPVPFAESNRAANLRFDRRSGPDRDSRPATRRAGTPKTARIRLKFVNKVPFLPLWAISGLKIR